MLGTGVFSSEYLVASKRLGRADLTLGMGWGRLASRNRLPNPVAQLFDGARARTATTGLGGEPSVEDFFRGEDVGIFGGVEIDLPYRTRLLAEYTSDAYEREKRLGTLKDPSPFSYGLGWRPAQGVDLVVSRQLGADIALSLSATLDTKRETPPKTSPAFWSVDEPPERWDASESFKPNTWYARLLFDV